MNRRNHLVFDIAIIAICLFIFSGAQCAGEKKPDPVLPDDTEMCDDACVHLLDLKCTREDGSLLGGPLPDGRSCRVWCEETQDNGFPLKPSCVVSLTTCDMSVCVE